MKKIYLVVILIVLLFTLKTGFAGYSMEQQDTPTQNGFIVPIENEGRWCLEMTIAGGTLFLGALGLWLKYKKKN